MYKLHLILKYLRKRRIAWVSLIAVTLCTAMVLVVISVMGGWLRMFEEKFHGLSGDIMITTSLRGFSHYQEMVDQIEKLPEVVAAAPVIESFGLLDIGRQKRDGVQVIGCPIDKIGKINKFVDSLYFQHQQYTEAANQPGVGSAQKAALLKQAQDAVAHASYSFSPLDADTRAELAKRRKNWPGMIVGSGVLEIRKDRNGDTVGRELYKYEMPATLVLFNSQDQNFSDPSAISRRAYWIADDSHTGVYQYDGSAVYIPFDIAQQDMGMAAATVTTADGRQLTQPARTHQIHVKLKAGVEPLAAKEKIREIVDNVMKEARLKDESLGAPLSWTDIVPKVETWRENKAMWIGAVEHEKVLVVFLFSMISVVAVFLIFCIFYMIVVEKTRDIGIIKSVGATATGVAGIFLGYGAAIGIVGGGLGFAAGFLIVSYINEIHTAMGKWMGIQIWNPEVYVFDRIPSQIDPTEASIIVAVAILSSIAGAIVPAIRAARMNPVEAVRYE